MINKWSRFFEGHKSIYSLHSEAITICGKEISKFYSNKSVRNGYFINYNTRGDILAEGYVKNNLRSYEMGIYNLFNHTKWYCKQINPMQNNYY